MRILYLSSIDIGLPVFYSLLKNHEIVAVITQPDKPRGRSNKFVNSPIAKAAEENKIMVFKREKIENELIEKIKELNPDYFITFAYGVILKKEFFSVSKFGGINIHPSLLPELRGSSPIQTALLRGYKKTGLTIQKIALKVDSGDILLQKDFEIKDEDDAITLEEKFSVMAGEMILEALEGLKKNTIKPIQQNETLATFCKMLKKEDGLIIWDENSKNIINKIRACIKWPIAHSFIDNIRINIYKAFTNDKFNFNDYKNFENGKIVFADKNNGIVVKSSDNLISLEILQMSTKKVLNWKDFLNGSRNLIGKKFSPEI